MVEVLNDNWPEMLEKMEASLSRAKFVAIDNEFSGLRDGSKEDISLFDDNESRYKKIKTHINEFVIVQFGISVFYVNADSSEYTCDVFTVYLFPRTSGRKDTSLKFQASSLEFLSRYKFDFNKMMYHGVPYISVAEQVPLKRALTNGSYAIEQMSKLSNDVADLQKNLCSKVMAWAVDAKEGAEMRLNCPPVLFPFLIHKDLTNACLDVITRYDKETKEIVARKVTQKVRKRFEDSFNRKDEEELFDKLIGFGKFFNLLMDKKLPLIGHNLLLDLMMMFQQFIGPLPASYSSFKKILTDSFPIVFDTKVMSTEIRKKNSINDAWDSDLQKLYYYLSGDKCENFAPGAPKVLTLSYEPTAGDEILASGDACQSDSKQFHTAGWDSFCSGFAFVKLAYINALIDAEEANDNTVEKFLPSCESLLQSVQPYMNKVHVSMGQTRHIFVNLNCKNLRGPDTITKWRQNILVETRGKSKLTMEYIEDAFIQFGSVDVKIIHSHKALVAASSQECMKSILKFCKNHPTFVAQQYTPLKHSTPLRTSLWLTSFACVWSGVYILLTSTDLF